MRIENMDTKEQWEDVVLYLTLAEASHLRDSLEALLEHPDSGHHYHISNSDFNRQITVLLEDV